MPFTRRKILLLDDSPEDRETWRRYLMGDASCEYVFIERNNLEDGLDACRDEQPDCILLDYHLPDGNGVEFIHDLREQGGTSRFPTVVLTATGNEAVAVSAMKAGAQDYLNKNRLDPEALCRTMNGAVYKAETDRLLARQRAELEEAYKQAREANARKDQFLAVLSHELRTPLTPVLAVVSSPEVARSSAEELEGIFGLIRRNVELEARLIDDLLDITRISHGKLELNTQPVDLHELIRHALDICRPTAQGKNVRLVDILAARHSAMQGDPARLQQVFWNLLNNAIKFTPAGGEVRIATADAGEARMEVSVTDSGIGIPAERIGKIFDAFEQGGSQVSRKFGGLGLGLAICKALVGAHGGKIDAESGGLGQGATFRVSLPVQPDLVLEKPKGMAVGEAVGQSSLPVASRKILLVEDHVDTARILSALLRRRGYEVFHAGTVADAKEIFERETVEVIISDLGLPDGRGSELIRALRAMRPVPSIVLSGYGEEDAMAGSLDAGAQEHLTKPVAWADLEAALGRLLA